MSGGELGLFLAFTAFEAVWFSDEDKKPLTNKQFNVLSGILLKSL